MVQRLLLRLIEQGLAITSIVDRLRVQLIEFWSYLAR